MAAIFPVLYGCSTKGTRVYTLGTPRFVPQSSPTSVVEQGIGQDDSPAGGIFLQWYPVPGTAGFNIYRADSVDTHGSPVNFVLIGSASSADSTMIDNNSVVIGPTYYYSMKAVSPDQSLSNWSDTVSIMLLARPTLISPGLGQSISKLGIVFTWTDNTNGGSTVLRLKDIIASKYIYVSPKAFSDYRSSPSFPYDTVTTAFDSLTSGHQYQWRIDRYNIGTDQQAKSIWQTFTVN